ncbi:reverse transcriptase [Elysia marginata]|uniref:Reverse transcriptase n=1 Tax=Elysia marginata TaxID=1093978 RepID=A0AAV4HC85_9GAST|nr:reverse transcriptase [Elysia marginata]
MIQFCLLIEKCHRSQRTLPRSSCCTRSRAFLRELWTKDIEELKVKTSYEYVLNLRERLDDTLKIARDELDKAQGRQKNYYDRTTKCRKFSVEEKVLVLLPTDSNKLLMQ